MRTYGLLTLGTIASFEGAGALNRDREREQLYNQAKQRAQQTGRLFVVIGDPSGGTTHGAGCGDTCIDIQGCDCPVSIRHDLTIGPTPNVKNNSAVVYVSCVLEYVSDYQLAWDEIIRMAGSVDNVFVVTVQSWTLTAALYPGARQTLEPIYVQGNSRPEYNPVPVTSTRKFLTALGLSAVAAWSLLPNNKNINK